MSRPVRRMVPASGRSTPEIRLSTVVLPEPFGPIRPMISPCATAKPRSLTATSPPKACRRPPTSSTGVPLSRLMRRTRCVAFAAGVAASVSNKPATPRGSK